MALTPEEIQQLEQALQQVEALKNTILQILKRPIPPY